jgi:hypothetical protein
VAKQTSTGKFTQLVLHGQRDPAFYKPHTLFEVGMIWTNTFSLFLACLSNTATIPAVNFSIHACFCAANDCSAVDSLALVHHVFHLLSSTFHDDATISHVHCMHNAFAVHQRRACSHKGRRRALGIFADTRHPFKTPWPCMHPLRNGRRPCDDRIGSGREQRDAEPAKFSN